MVVTDEGITEGQLAEWRALCDAVGPGPWRAIKDPRYFPVLQVVPLGVRGGCHNGEIVINEAAPQTMEGCVALADFLAASRDAVPALLAEVMSLRQVIANQTITIEAMQDIVRTKDRLITGDRVKLQRVTMMFDATMELRRTERAGVPGDSIAELEANRPEYERRMDGLLARWRTACDAADAP